MATRITKPGSLGSDKPEPDTSDIPEAGKEWFDKAKLVLPKPEPFCLKPEDALAPAVIRAWIHTAIVLGVSEAKIAKAYAHAFAFTEWQKANPDKVKVPD